MKELPRIDDPQRRPSYRTETPPNSKGNSEPNLHPLNNARHMREGSKAHRAPLPVELMKPPGDGKEGKDHSEQGVVGELETLAWVNMKEMNVAGPYVKKTMWWRGYFDDTKLDVNSWLDGWLAGVLGLESMH